MNDKAKAIHYRERFEPHASDDQICKVVKQIEEAKAGRGPQVIIDTQRLDSLDPRVKRALGF